MSIVLDPTTLNLNQLEDAALFDFLVMKGNGVKGLAEATNIVPPRYVYPPNERTNSIEVIDAFPYLSKPIDLSGLEGPNRGAIIEALCDAAKKVGFLQVVNHGVPLEVLDSVKRAAHAFFNLPPEKKAPLLKGMSPCPGVFYGTNFWPERERPLEWNDCLSMTYVGDQEAMQFWPRECRVAALEYLKAADKVINSILSALMRALDAEMEESTMSKYVEERVVQMNYYPICPNAELTVGVGRHSDVEALTVLLQDDIGGLYVKVEDNGWIQIPPVEGALVVNVGDTLEILSNGRYKSAEHRVVTSNTKTRVSIPIFARPKGETKIGPLLGVVEADGKAIYKQLVYGEYRSKYMEAGHQGKMTLDFAKNTE